MRPTAPPPPPDSFAPGEAVFPAVPPLPPPLPPPATPDPPAAVITPATASPPATLQRDGRRGQGAADDASPTAGQQGGPTASTHVAVTTPAASARLCANLAGAHPSASRTAAIGAVAASPGSSSHGGRRAPVL